jgi:cobalt-zinc-cadmium efflux system protein
MKRSVLSFWIVFLMLLVVFILSKNVIALAESLHALFDAITVSFSVFALYFIKNSNYTYGLHRLEVLSALINTSIVFVGSILSVILSILYVEFNIKENSSLVVVSSILVSLILLLTINNREKGIRLHTISDILGYIIGGIGAFISIEYNFENIIDLITAIVVILVMFILNINTIKISLDVLMEKSPVDISVIEKEVREIFPSAHHIHVWALCDHMRIATLHVEENPETTLKELDLKREEIEKILLQKFNINHVTIQFESKRENQKN